MTGRETGSEAITHAIEAARAAGRPALAAFLTAGRPRRDGFAELARAIAAEAEIVELGVPFSDPMADGLTIQESSRAALEAGVTLSWILDLARELRGSAPLVLMSYLNPLLAFGIERLAARAAEAGVAGLIVPDLPLEESAPLREVLDEAGIALVQLVTPVTPPDRLARLCRVSRGFVYAVTTTGTTGGSVGDPEAMLDYLARVRAASAVPVLAGFGIRTAGQLRAVAGRVDGAIVGSALVELLERGEDPVAFLRRLRGGGPDPKEAPS